MGRFRQMLYVLLAFLWVPLTQHCELEALGFIEKTCAPVASNEGHSCGGDSCNELENGGYKPSSDGIKVAAPHLLAFACAIRLNLAPVDPTVAEISLLPTAESPLDWVPSWQFVRRAAPPSRAPSLIVA